MSPSAVSPLTSLNEASVILSISTRKLKVRRGSILAAVCAMARSCYWLLAVGGGHQRDLDDHEFRRHRGRYADERDEAPRVDVVGGHRGLIATDEVRLRGRRAGEGAGGEHRVEEILDQALDRGPQLRR